MTPIYICKNGAIIYQCGYREIPHDLKKAKINLVLFMAEEFPPLNHFTGAKLEYYPTDDKIMEPGTLEYIQMLTTARTAAKSALKHVKQGKNVVISCAAGKNRSGITTACLLKELTTSSPDEIVAWIRERRPGSLSNPSFVTMLY